MRALSGVKWARTCANRSVFCPCPTNWRPLNSTVIPELESMNWNRSQLIERRLPTITWNLVLHAGTMSFWQKQMPLPHYLMTIAVLTPFRKAATNVFSNRRDSTTGCSACVMHRNLPLTPRLPVSITCRRNWLVSRFACRQVRLVTSPWGIGMRMRRGNLTRRRC